MNRSSSFSPQRTGGIGGGPEEGTGPSREQDGEVESKLPIGFKESMLGFLFKVRPVPTFLPKLFLFPRMGMALLPVAAGVSLLPEEPADAKTNLPEGVLSPERAAKWLLEVAAEEDCISKKSLGGVWFGLVSVKNALDYHAHREFSTPFCDIE